MTTKTRQTIAAAVAHAVLLGRVHGLSDAELTEPPPDDTSGEWANLLTDSNPVQQAMQAIDDDICGAYIKAYDRAVSVRCCLQVA